MNIMDRIHECRFVSFKLNYCFFPSFFCCFLLETLTHTIVLAIDSSDISSIIGPLLPSRPRDAARNQHQQKHTTRHKE